MVFWRRHLSLSLLQDSPAVGLFGFHLSACLILLMSQVLNLVVLLCPILLTSLEPLFDIHLLAYRMNPQVFGCFLVVGPTRPSDEDHKSSTRPNRGLFTKGKLLHLFCVPFALLILLFHLHRISTDVYLS
jgi:hypothetical protein